MCNGSKKCKACAAAQIGKSMANKSRKSSKGLLMDGVLIAGGAVLGGYAVPKMVEQVDPTGKVDPKIVDVAVAALGLLGSKYVGKKLGNEAGKITMGVGVGALVSLGNNLMSSMGYVVSPTYDVNQVLGANDWGNSFRTTGANPGAL